MGFALTWPELFGRLSLRAFGLISAKPMCSVSLLKVEDSSDYAYCINGNMDALVSYDGLADAIRQEIGEEEEPTFAIYTDEETPVGEVVAVMNIGKKLDYRVILATQPEE